MRAPRRRMGRADFWIVASTNVLGWALEVAGVVLLVVGIGEAVEHGRDPAAFARERCVADEGAPTRACVDRWTDRSGWSVFGERAWPVIPLIAAGQLVQAAGTVTVTRRWNRPRER